MADAKVRVNTLKFAFGRGSSEPTDAEMFEFCRERQFNPEEIYSIHKEQGSRAIFVKFKSEDFMKAVFKNMQPVISFKYADRKAVNVTVSEADITFKYVRIFNLPPEIEDKEIYQALSPYGIIRQQVREKYHPSTGFPVFSTVRGLYIELAKEIPPQVRVRHFQARIFYDGMVNKCFICKSTEHIKANCPRRNAPQNPSSVQGRLYSDIVEARDLRPDFAKRAEEKQLECQMTVLSKQTELPGTSGCGTGAIKKSHEAIICPPIPNTSKQASTGMEVEQSPATAAVPQAALGQEDVEKQVTNDQQDHPKNEEPFIEQTSKKRGRGRNKNRGNKDDSSNESETESTLHVPGSASLLNAQQMRTRSRSKQPRIDSLTEKPDGQVGAVGKTPNQGKTAKEKN